MALKFRDVANPPNVVATAILFDVFRRKMSSGDFFGQRDRFEHGTVAVSRSTHIVDLAGSRSIEERIKRANQISTVDVVPNLFLLVPENRVRCAQHCAFHQVRQEAMQLRAGMIRTSQAAAAKTVDALQRAEAVRRDLRLASERTVILVNQLVQLYREEKMPRRSDTRRSYDVWLRNHIVPKWGGCVLSDIQARPVELWLASLDLAPKSKVHVRGVLRLLWDFAMWRGDVPVQRNPMELVKIRAATKRTKKPRSLTVDEFQAFAKHLDDPFRTLALVCVCFGLRISEALGLQWRDIDWLNCKLTIERGIVCQVVDDVKTPESQRPMHIDNEILCALKRWKQASQFTKPENWIFASPVQLGQLPWSYDQVWRMYQKAATKARIGRLGTHGLRHTYRSWLDAAGTPIAVQQKLMRHADIRTK